MLTSLLSAVAIYVASATLVATPTTGSAANPRTSPAPDIHYSISMPEPSSHLYSVTLDVGQVRGPVLKLQMPVWSPGRYARMNFAVNIQDFSVTDGNGKQLKWDRENGSLWRVYPGTARRAVVHYRVFGDNLSGTFSVLDSLHANWNGGSVFMYVVGRKPSPVTLHIDAPSGWHIINGDTRTPDQADYSFENYDRLIDTPTEVAPSFMVDSFTVDNRLYRTVVHHNGPTTPEERARFVASVRRIVEAHNRVIGPPPLRMYTFMFHIGFPGGDGMEHLYSTQIIDRRPWADTASVLAGVGTAAHEYFHVWNVKRIRPMALGPFDYTTPQFQPSLWVAEGWTQYYGEMATSRAKLGSKEDTYASIAGIVQANLTAPGRKEVSARMASFEAPLFDGAPHAQKNNGSQTYFSYYFKGAGIALALDLMIRDQSDNVRSLDNALGDLKKLSWDRPNASYYLQGRGYTEADVEHAVSQAMGQDMHQWFDRYVGGTDDIDFDHILSLAGLRLDRSGRRWTVSEIPDASARQVAIRDVWLTDSHE
jgi:predicted metalloprotease with PDZ domain